MLMLWPVAADAQIKIGGNVYGGGNHAEVRGSTKVTVKAGDIGAVMEPNAEQSCHHRRRRAGLPLLHQRGLRARGLYRLLFGQQ